MTEVWDRKFDDLPRFNSFCGFKNLWSVRDTPASGIQSRGEDSPALSAYGFLMEMAWVLIQHNNHFREVYNAALRKGHALGHQFALRKTAVQMLKEIWSIFQSDFRRVKRGNR